MAKLPDKPKTIPEGTILPHELILHWRKVAARAAMTPQFLHDLEARVFLDQFSRMGDRMVLQMQSRVLADQVDVDTQRVPFRREVRPQPIVKTMTLKGDRWRVLPHAAAAVSTSYSLRSRRRYWIIGAIAFIVLAALTWRREAPRTFNPKMMFEPIAVKGEVTIEARYWNTFPENTRVYPKELGSPVRLIELGEPDVRYFDGSR